MKNLVIIIGLLFVSHSLLAQDQVEPLSDIEEKQIGVSITDFFLTFLSFNNPPDNTSPSILVLYKKTKNGKRRRYGFGGRINWNKQSDGDKAFSVRGNLNFGREFVRKVGKRWTPYVGYETVLSMGYDHFIEDRGTDKSEKEFNRSASIGWKGLVGIEYHLNKHLSLLTESSYGISFNYFLSKLPRNSRPIRESYSVGTFYIPPVSLILSYHF